MEKIRFLIKSVGRKPLLVVLASLLFLTQVFAEVKPTQTDSSEKEKVVRQVAQKWIQVGAEQYKRGYFKAAKQSFLRAQDYQEYLTADEKEKLTALLEKTHKGILEREYILDTIRKADELVKQGDINKAKENLQGIKDSEFLTETERELINKGLQNLGNQLEQQNKEASEIYTQSVELYNAGELEKAREGFVKIAAYNLETAKPGETAEDYLLKIDNVLAQKAQPATKHETQPEDELGATIASITKELVNGKTEPMDEQKKADEPNVQSLAKVEENVAAETITESNEQGIEAVPAEGQLTQSQETEETYIDIINRKRDIRKSHTRAIVNDAVSKVQNYISNNEFDKAKEEVERTERIVNGYQLELGEELSSQHIGELKQLKETITQEQEQRNQQLQEQKQLEAIEAQRKYRDQMEEDRTRRVAELMDNAVAYQSQQRYEEALGQIDSVISIDPFNNQALLLKQTLEDMISFRRQLEANRESEKERVNTLISNDEALIPYAEELVHPKDWREIIASPFRQQDVPIGRSPADAVIYKQLDEVVDLSQLTSEMPLGEALELLKNSTDPPLKVFVNWRDLYDNADIEQTTPINMDPIAAIPLKKGIGLLLEAVSGGFANINYIVDGGVITIATAESLPSEMETLAYDITDLIGRPADFYSETGGISVGGGGEAGTEELEVQATDRTELITEATIRADNLVQLIQQTVMPSTWFEVGGEGTVTVYERKKIIIYQTREVHNLIGKMLDDLRKSLGNQVSIEARFLLVGENFLEDIGLDVDFSLNNLGIGRVIVNQSSDSMTLPTDTGVSGSMVPSLSPLSGPVAALNAVGGYGNILNDLQVNVILRATQAHRDAKSLTAPKVTVLSGEMASMRVQRYRRYPYDIEIDLQQVGNANNELSYWTINTTEGTIVTGTLLNITPVITPDKRNVLLNIVTEMRDFLGWQNYNVVLPVLGGTAGGIYSIQYPETEISRVETRVSVPDRATLLLGGQRITSEVEKEAGVPVLSKVPVLGRLFSNRSKVKDNLILLMLVKPTIILREEAENKAIAAMESNN